MLTPPPIDEEYRPLNRRRRVLIAVLAVATAVTGVLTMLSPPAGVQRKRVLSTTCAPGQTENCVGGRAAVIMLPIASGASSASSASAPAR